MPTISLSMIARDEENFLPACLESVRGLVDEIVLVDTGSTDRTVEVARGAGAIVKAFPWNDDFSAARNVSLDACTSDWVLILDADERLAPGCGPIIREAVSDPGSDRILLPLYDATHLGASPNEVISGAASQGQPVLLARLFRRTPGLHWVGCVHELMTAPKLDGEIRQTKINAPVIHFGYVKEIKQSRNKIQRNLRLIQNRCDRESENPWVWGLLVRAQMNIGDLENAAKSAETAWRALESTKDVGTAATLLIDLAARRASLQLESGHIAEALVCLDWATSWCGFHPNLGFMRAQVLYRLALGSDNRPAHHDYLMRALDDLDQCQKHGNRLSTVPILKGATSWSALGWKAIIELLLGKPEVALSNFDSALCGNPGFRFARIGYAEALIDLGRTTEALETLKPLLSAGIPDAWALAAEAYANKGETDKTTRCINTLKTAPVEAFQLRHRLYRLERVRRAQSLQ